MYLYLEYLPDYLREIQEFKAIAKGLKITAESSYQYTLQIGRDLFIATAGQQIIARWETIFRIHPAAGDSLEVRRDRVLARILGQLPITEWTLRGMLNDICGADGYTMEVRYEEYTIIIRLRPKAREQMSRVAELLQWVIPANLLCDLAQNYNVHGDLRKLTHAQLKGRTHLSIREEEL